MAASSLYGVLKPVISLVSIYGLNIEPKKRVRPLLKKLKRITWQSLVLTSIIFAVGISPAQTKGKKELGEMKIRIWTNIFIVGYVNWRIGSINVLLATLKTIKKSADNEKAFRKIRRVLFFAVMVVVLSIFTQIVVLVIIGRDDPMPAFDFSGMLIMATLSGMMHFSWNAFFSSLSNFTFFVCLVIYYVSLSFDKPMEKLKRCKSLLRRSKMTADLIGRIYHTNKLTRVTEAFAAPLMFILKMTAILQFFLMLHYWENKRQPSLGDCASIYPTFIYLWFLRIAPSANSKLSQLYRTLLESVMEDDLWLSRDPTSRPHLLRLKLSHLEQLSHLSLVQAQFTVLNEPVDEADVFLFFVEIISTWNTIYSAPT